MNKVKFLLTAFAAAALVYLAGCDNDDGPKVTFTEPTFTNISTTTVTVSGNVSVSGGTISERGFVWSENEEPTTAGSKIADANGGEGDFTLNITGLENNTEYFLRSYAVVGSKTFYGEDVILATSAPIELIQNGDFSLPDAATTTQINALTAWKTDENTDGNGDGVLDLVGREKVNTEYSVWVSQYSKSLYQVVGTVPAVETVYKVSAAGNNFYNYWDPYDAKVAVRFSVFTGSDPKTRTVIGKTTLNFGPSAAQYSYNTQLADFTLSSALASAHAGKNLVIEFDVMEALEAIDYPGYDDADVWMNFDKVSVKQQ